jgi:alanine-glyoxylate transaminase/(R)-3-amino-2-methylpropionate-pyruvate transaminase
MGLTSHTPEVPVPGHNVHHVECPEPYRSSRSGTPEEIAAAAAADIGDLIRYSTPGRVAGFIAEPIQGVGGVTLGAPNYFREAYRIVREFGGLCIADEVQTGFGRTGAHYWGFENFGVEPDIVTMAKGFGNGVRSPPSPPGGGRRVLAQRLHFNTFGGNPVSMAAGLAVMDVIEEEGLQENARVVGARLLEGSAGPAPPHIGRRCAWHGPDARRGAGE